MTRKRSDPRPSGPYKTFQNCTIVFGDDTDGNKRSDLLRWARNSSARVLERITPEVTHLVCSERDYEDKEELVVAAQKHARIHIVTYDWFLISATWKTRKREAGEYIHSGAEKRAKRKAAKAKVKHEVQKATSEYDKGCEDAAHTLSADNYHIYRDGTSYFYDVCLSRADPVQNNNQQYLLKLFESNVRPHTYAVSLTFKTKELPESIDIICPTGSAFADAFAAFKRTFASLTNVQWDFRFWNVPPQRKPAREATVPGMDGTGPSAIVPLPASDSDDDEDSDPGASDKARVRRRQVKQARIETREANAGPQNRYYSMILPRFEDGEPAGDLGMYETAVGKFGPMPKDKHIIGGQLVLAKK